MPKLKNTRASIVLLESVRFGGKRLVKGGTHEMHWRTAAAYVNAGLARYARAKGPGAVYPAPKPDPKSTPVPAREHVGARKLRAPRGDTRAATPADLRTVKAHFLEMRENKAPFAEARKEAKEKYGVSARGWDELLSEIDEKMEQGH